MNRQEAINIVNGALDRLVAGHPQLLDLDVSERALTHHLAKYISTLVPARLNVDVEYNRHGGDPKRLNLRHRRAIDNELRATTVFPDVIVHVRNTDEFNYIVLEVKKPGEDLEYDNEKLHAFKEELGYRHAAHVILGIGQSGVLVRDVIWVD